VKRTIVWLVRNIIGTALIIGGLVLCVPGVPGPGIVTILIGVGVLDFEKKHRLVGWIRSFRVVRKVEEVSRVELSAGLRKIEHFLNRLEGRRQEEDMNPKDRIRLSEGDITRMEVDAIVNAANNDLQLGGGVAGAIRRAGGPAIQEECNQIGPIPVGEAAITTGGNLKAKHVIHAASMRLGERTSEENLIASTKNSLRRADEKGLKSIAFPAIGTGIAGFPLERCAQVMLGAVLDHLKGKTSLEVVHFVLFGRDAYEAFVKEAEKL
jgi:O-acetyl-ADP-ribose deacetylase (regulator of RNase III)